MNNKQLFLLGARHSIPICLGYISVGTAYAVMALQSGYTQFETILMSMLSYSGSGQFFAVTMAKEHSSLVAIALGLFLLNFRYFIMSTCIFSRFEKLSNLSRTIFAHYVTDEPFAIFTTAPKDLVKLSYLAGLVLTSWCSWILGAIIGVTANDYLPVDLVNAMNVALYALFIAIIVPPAKVNFKLMLIIVSAAVINIILTSFMNACWAILLTIVLSSLVGAMFMDNKKSAVKTEADVKVVEN
ncbi:AzlC family ABC transporter permease [Succinivibrio dextrinosolvens]|uniref:AzlC family ABC transporter permease n=1 Tax=Succinivibrio dextrinosolvens TaxID=83771 RepID=UPI0013E97160|nr:AzlC family ABC transporter permease [Succinivibrio dextrinosolvens]